MNRHVEMLPARRSLERVFYLFTTLVLLSIPLVCLTGCPETPPPITANQEGTKPTPPVISQDTGRRKDAGHLKADRLFHDFGKVDKNQKLKTSFVLTNDGKETLKIGKVDSSCKCVVAPLKTKVLEPNQSVTLEVLFTTSAVPGPTNQSVQIFPEKPSLPIVLTLRLTAEVKRYITVEPPQFEIKMSKKKQPDITLKISSVDEKPFRILGAQVREKAIQLLFDKTKAAHTHTVPVKVDRSLLDAARPAGVISLQLDHPKSRSLSIGFKLISPYVAHPSTKRVANVRPGKKVTEYISIVSNFQEPFELGEIRSDNGLVQVKNIEKIRHEYKLEIEMQIPQNPQQKIVRDYLNIQIKNEPKNSLKVLFYAIL